MNLSQLQAVLQVIRSGSVAEAASRLYLTQPAVTKQIRSLEDDLGTKLFEKVGRRIAPTPVLLRALPRIELLLHEMEVIRGALTEQEVEMSGDILIGCGPILARTVMPEVVASCRKRYPGVEIVMMEATLPEQVTQLRSGEIRIGFGPDYLEDSDLVFEPLVPDELVLIVPEGHPLSKQKTPVALAQIRDEPMIMHLYARMVERALRQIKRSPRQFINDHRISARMRNTETIAAFVAKGLGISLVPRYIIELLRPAGVIPCPLRQKLPVSIGCYHRRGSTLTPLEKLFLTLLQETLKRRLNVGAAARE